MARFVVAAAVFTLVAPVSGLLFAGGTRLAVAFARLYVGVPVPEPLSRILLWTVCALSGLLMGVWLGSNAWAIMSEDEAPRGVG